MNREVFKNEKLLEELKKEPKQEEIDYLNEVLYGRAINPEAGNNIIFSDSKRGNWVFCHLMEKMAELQKEICKYLWKGDSVVSKIDILEEIADVSISLDQIKESLNISEEEFTEMVNIKLNRAIQFVLNNETKFEEDK